MFLMTLRRLEVCLLINTRQREAKGGEGRWLGARKEGEEENRKEDEKEGKLLELKLREFALINSKINV